MVEVGYHEKREVTVTTSCQRALTAYPCDFRSPKTMLLNEAGAASGPWWAFHRFLGEVWVNERGQRLLRPLTLVVHDCGGRI